jgi:hypothetical protein
VAAAGVASILSSLQHRADADGTTVVYTSGNDVAAAVAAAKSADAVVVVVGSTSSEGTDRSNTSLPAAHLAYLHAVAAAQPNTIVAIMAPGAITMASSWTVLVRAIMCFFLPGQAQGAAVVNILYGDANPVGRLPITMPNVENEVEFTADQYPGKAFGSGLEAHYSEQLQVGYGALLSLAADPPSNCRLGTVLFSLSQPSPHSNCRLDTMRAFGQKFSPEECH